MFVIHLSSYYEVLYQIKKAVLSVPDNLQDAKGIQHKALTSIRQTKE